MLQVYRNIVITIFEASNLSESGQIQLPQKKM